MKSIFRFDDILEAVRDKLYESLDSILDSDKGLILKPKIQEKLNKKPLYYQILAHNIFQLIHLEFEIDYSHGNKFNEVLTGFINTNNEKSIYDFRDELKNNFEKKIIKDMSFSGIERFSFNRNNKSLDFIILINVFIDSIEDFRFEKFKYFIEVESNKADYVEGKLVPKHFFDLLGAFPEAYEKFIKLLHNRYNLLGIEHVISIYESKEAKKNRIGDFTLFEPDSDFSKIFNNQNEIPDLIYNYILKVSLEDDYINLFFCRLRIILRYSTYKNEVLMKKNKASTSIFKNIVSKFTGSEYKYTSEVYITKEFESDLEDFKKLINNKSLDIKLMKLQFPN